MGLLHLVQICELPDSAGVLKLLLQKLEAPGGDCEALEMYSPAMAIQHFPVCDQGGAEPGITAANLDTAVGCCKLVLMSVRKEEIARPGMRGTK